MEKVHCLERFKGHFVRPASNGCQEKDQPRTNHNHPCLFQPFYKRSPNPGPRIRISMEVSTNFDLAFLVRDVARVTLRRAPWQLTSSMTAESRRDSSVLTAGSLARRSSTFRITFVTSIPRSQFSVTRCSKMTAYGGLEETFELNSSSSSS